MRNFGQIFTPDHNNWVCELHVMNRVSKSIPPIITLAWEANHILQNISFWEPKTFYKRYFWIGKIWMGHVFSNFCLGGPTPNAFSSGPCKQVMLMEWVCVLHVNQVSELHIILVSKIHTCKKNVLVIGIQLSLGSAPSCGSVTHRSFVPFIMPSWSMLIGMP